MTIDSKPRKVDVQNLQRAIVNGLEDVKAQDIRVFNTEHLSPLFERVIVASGTSNRQTKALASSVSDAVKEAGFPKPRTEGEDNGEWIIVDCGQAVVHVMQPTIRAYYNLEEIWGGKVVRLKPSAGAKSVAGAVKRASPKRATVQSVAEPASTKPTARKAAAAKSAGTAAQSPSKAASAKPSAASVRKAAAKAAAPAQGQTATQPRTQKAPSKRVTVVVGAPAKKPVAKKVPTAARTRRKPAA